MERYKIIPYKDKNRKFFNEFLLIDTIIPLKQSDMFYENTNVLCIGTWNEQRTDTNGCFKIIASSVSVFPLPIIENRHSELIKWCSNDKFPMLYTTAELDNIVKDQVTHNLPALRNYSERVWFEKGLSVMKDVLIHSTLIEKFCELEMTQPSASALLSGYEIQHKVSRELSRGGTIKILNVY